MDNEKTFFLNSLDSLSKGNSLIEIRSKGKFSRPLNKGALKHLNVKKNLIISYNTYIMPFFIIIFSIVVYIIRRMKIKEAKIRYKS